MRVLFCAAECAPFVKTGGLGDVVAALPRSLLAQGVGVRVLMPKYRDAFAEIGATETVARFDALMGGPATVQAVRADGLELLLLDAPHLFDRPGNPYVQADGSDWPDNHLRFGALAHVAAAVATGTLDGDWRADAVHAHDWHAGLVPLYLSMQGAGAPPSMMTIHNIMYQGLFPGEVRAELGLPEQGFTPDGYEFHGQVGFLKAGLMYANKVSTVSPTYAEEIKTAAFGLGLEGVINHRGGDVVGILNGIDQEGWDPATDPLINSHYKAPNVKARAANRRQLNTRFGLTPGDGPLMCVVSRLTEQKGLDLLLNALPDFIKAGGKLALLGSGDRVMQQGFEDAALAYPSDVGTVIGYDEALAHQLQAGSDAIIVPSRFEPCGLTQMYGLRYGCLPIVAHTGGLADTVTDCDTDPNHGTGFVFTPVTQAALSDALMRAIACFADAPRWRGVMRRAMKQDLSWDASAATYIDIYGAMRADTGVAA